MATLQQSHDTLRGTSMFQIDADSLNHCLDEIEAFTNNLYGVYDELKKYKSKKNQMSRSKEQRMQQRLVSKIPPGDKFMDIFKKFKLAINLAANLENHMTYPNPSDLCRLMYQALVLILDVCRMAHGDLAPHAASPLFTPAGKSLNENSLGPQAKEMLYTLGPAWNKSEAEWTDGPVPIFTPVFTDGFQPYRDDTLRSSLRNSSNVQQDNGHVVTDGSSSQSSQPSEPSSHSTGDEDAARTRLDREAEMLKLEQQELEAKTKKLELEKEQLEEQRRTLEQRSQRSAHASPAQNRREQAAAAAPTSAETQTQRENSREVIYIVQPPMDYNQQQMYERYATENIGPRQRSFLAQLLRDKKRIAQVMFTLAGENPGQLAVAKHEYLEVVNSEKLWWQCKNAGGKVGFVPSTILSPLDLIEGNDTEESATEQEPVQPVGPPEPRPRTVYRNAHPDTPPVVRQNPPRPLPKPVYERNDYDAYVPTHRPVQQERQQRDYRDDDVDYRQLDRHDSNRYAWNPELMKAEREIPSYIKERIVVLTDTGVQVEANGITDNYHEGHGAEVNEPHTIARQSSNPPTPPELSRLEATILEASTPVNTTPPLQNGFTNGSLDLPANLQQDHLIIRRRADKFHEELTQTLTKQNILAVRRAAKADDMEIDENSTAGEVQKWLEHKEFSMRTMKLLTNQTGATLFSLTKPQLQNFCGKEEGQRLYSFLLVQKSKSGYDTANSDELKAVLALRKRHTDESRPNGPSTDGQQQQNGPSTSPVAA